MSAFDFPSTRLLRDAVMLRSIACALWVAEAPDFENESSWDASNYSMQDSQSARGTISFSDAGFVAVLQDYASPRAPSIDERCYQIDRFFMGIPQVLRELAEAEALQYVLDELDGGAQPVITTAFWALENDETCAAAEAWPDVVLHGAHLIERYLADTDTVLEHVAEDYEFEDKKLSLIRDLFDRKRNQRDSEIHLSAHEIDIVEINLDPNGGIETCRQTMGEIGIIL